MKVLPFIIMPLTACAPISPSIPKVDASCMSKYNSVQLGDRSYDVETKMGTQPESETVVGSSMTQVYDGCRQFEFAYYNDEVIDKQAK